MIDLKETLSGIFTAIGARREQQGKSGIGADVVATAVERVVDGVDERVRLVGGYQRRLSEAVRLSLEYTDGLVERIAEPITLSAQAFGRDPYINAFFVNPEDIQRFIAGSRELYHYAHRPGEGEPAEYQALLCMRKREKRVLGMDQSDGRLIREVEQTLVSFSEHRFHSLGTSEQEVRLDLRCCLFSGLIESALAKVARLREERRRLETERRVITGRLRDADPGTGAEQARQALKHRLQQLTGTLEDIGYLTPEAILAHIVAVFMQPQRFVHLSQYPLALSRLGVKRTGDAAGTPLLLNQVTLQGREPRIVVLVRVTRDEYHQALTINSLQEVL